MIGTIKNYILAALAIAAAILTALWKTAVAGRERDKRKAQETASKVKDKATQAIIDGEKKKEKSRASDDSDMSHFG